MQTQHHTRQRVEIQRLPGGIALKQGRRLLNFSDNDYLGLSFHPALQAAAAAAITEYGVGAGASRLVSGNHPLYTELEKTLVQMKGTEDALVFGSGFLMNLGVVNGLLQRGDLILADRLIHASLVDAMTLSGARFQRFRHNDMTHLEELLKRHGTLPTAQSAARSEGFGEYSPTKIYILTEGVFSMDGDVAPLPAMLGLAERFHATVIMDDAHGFGVLGNGLGTAAAQGVAGHPQLLQTGTFSKACGSYGGYVAGSSEMIETLVNRARSLIYTTGLPPSVVAANLAALKVIQAEPERGEKALHYARIFCEMLKLPAPQSAIVPVIIGTAEAALKAAHMLEEKGFLVIAIRPPTVPVGSSRLRIAFSAIHTEEMVKNLAIAIQSNLLARNADHSTTD